MIWSCISLVISVTEHLFMWLFLGLGLQTEATEAARSKILGDIFFSGITLKCRAVSLSSPGPAYLPSVYILWWCLCLNLLLIFFFTVTFFLIRFESSLYILDIYPLSCKSFARNHFPGYDLSFNSSNCFYEEPKFLILLLLML